MKLHVFSPSPNSRKALFVDAYLDLGSDIEQVDLPPGAQKSAEFLALNPNGRVPVLELDDGSTLWESNAIVNRLCAEVDTSLWPKSNQRYDIMRWQFWESCHWTPACSPFISHHLFGNSDVDLDAAATNLEPFAQVLDGHLSKEDWLSGSEMTAADISVSAILCYREACQYPLQSYDNIARWMSRIEALDIWQRINPVPEAA
ncbi:glutathione S-transferase family protein [Ruegeria sp. 2205SS24-7]|uniref:glutathione S-transferase family protein n=1 Tax=Ruegeria discodermiae TaxID=3064389 RepID=UPI00274205C5|nr:glutathione S-transferase family protein [Ruegeria sp. 2205SS24-7]MDP5216934.1 glutathione S-transferase family protein [Ruegeria sp. 2205SS24-7]